MCSVRPVRSVLALVALVGLVAPAFADVIAISGLERGRTATIEGTVDRFFDSDDIRLRDESGTVRVYLGPDILPIESGERLSISGIMDDDLVLNEFYAREITQENGDVLVIDRRDE